MNVDHTTPDLLALDWRIPHVNPRDYLIELTAANAVTAEPRYLAIRIE